MSAYSSFVNNLLDAAFRGQTYTGSTIRIGLYKTNLPSAGGTEITGGSYARQTVTFSPAAAKAIELTANASFTDLPIGPSNTVVAIGVFNNTTLIDEQVLSTPFTPDASNNELELGYRFELNA